MTLTFEWDEARAQRNVVKHGWTPAESMMVKRGQGSRRQGQHLIHVLLPGDLAVAHAVLGRLPPPQTPLMKSMNARSGAGTRRRPGK